MSPKPRPSRIRAGQVLLWLSRNLVISICRGGGGGKRGKVSSPPSFSMGRSNFLGPALYSSDLTGAGNVLSNLACHPAEEGREKKKRKRGGVGSSGSYTYTAAYVPTRPRFRNKRRREKEEGGGKNKCGRLEDLQGVENDRLMSLGVFS